MPLQVKIGELLRGEDEDHGCQQKHAHCWKPKEDASPLGASLRADAVPLLRPNDCGSRLGSTLVGLLIRACQRPLYCVTPSPAVVK